MIRAVIFDMDGLMFDTERLSFRLWQDVCAEHGRTFTLDMMAGLCGGTPEIGRQVFQKAFGAGDADFTFESCVAETRGRIADEFARNGVPIKPGLKELLQFLQQIDCPAAVASSSPAEYVRQYVQQAGLDRWFSAYIGAGDFCRSKPDPEDSLQAAYKLSTAPAQCLVLEDSARGIQAAHAAGMHCIWIPDLIRPDAAVIALADAVCDTLADVIPWVKQHSPGTKK